MSMYVGESLKGDGAEVAHIDLLIGDKEGPVGVAFAKRIRFFGSVPCCANAEVARRKQTSVK